MKNRVISIIIILALLFGVCVPNMFIAYAGQQSAAAQSAGRTITYKVNSINPVELNKVISDFNNRYGYLDIEDTIVIEFPNDYLYKLYKEIFDYEDNAFSNYDCYLYNDPNKLKQKYGDMYTGSSESDVFMILRYKRSNGKYGYATIGSNTWLENIVIDNDFYKYFKVSKDSSFCNSLFYSKDAIGINPVGQYFFGRLKMAPVSGYSFIYQGKMYICGLESAYNLLKEFFRDAEENKPYCDIPKFMIKDGEGFRIILSQVLKKININNTESSVGGIELRDGQIPYLIQALKEIRQKARELTKNCKNKMEAMLKMQEFFDKEIHYDWKSLKEGKYTIIVDRIKSDSEWNTEKGKKYAWWSHRIMYIWYYKYGICQDYAILGEVLGFYMNLDTQYVDSLEAYHAWNVHDIHGIHIAWDLLDTMSRYLLTPFTVLLINNFRQRATISEILDWYSTKGFIKLLKTNKKLANDIFEWITFNLWGLPRELIPKPKGERSIVDTDDSSLSFKDRLVPIYRSLYYKISLFELFPKFKEKMKKVASINDIFKDLDNRNLDEFEVRSYYISLKDLYKEEPQTLNDNIKLNEDIVKSILKYVSDKTGKDFMSWDPGASSMLPSGEVDRYLTIFQGGDGRTQRIMVTMIIPYIDLVFMIKPILTREGWVYGFYVGKLPKSDSLNSISDTFINDYLKNIPVYRNNLVESDLILKAMVVEDEPVVDKFDIVVKEGDTFKLNISQKYGLSNVKLKFITISNNTDIYRDTKFDAIKATEIQYLGNSTFKALEQGVVRIIPVYRDEELLKSESQLSKTIKNINNVDLLKKYCVYAVDTGILDLNSESFISWGFVDEEKVANSSWFYTMFPFDQGDHELTTIIPTMTIRVTILPSPKAYFKVNKIIVKLGTTVKLPIATTGSGASYKIVVSNPNIVEVKNKDSIKAKSKGSTKLILVNSNGNKSECIVEVK